MNKYFFKILSLTIGLGFLYFPILTLIAYSFNDNKRVMVWKGFSFNWYSELFNNEQIIEAFIISIKIAALSATFATILGVMIGYSLVRIRTIPFKTFYIFLSSTPLVLPELILGLSMLLFFISLTARCFCLYHFLYSEAFSSLKSAAKSIKIFLILRCLDMS